MRLLLVRHGETVDNVSQVYAGRTDSALTVHGILQAQRLAIFLADQKPALTNIYSSDLERARKTAEAIVDAQQQKYGDTALRSIHCLNILQEKDFGSLEKVPFRVGGATVSHGANTGAESKESLTARADMFLDGYLIPLLTGATHRTEAIVLVVSHGMLLSYLWKALLRRFDQRHVTLNTELKTSRSSMLALEHLGAWSNTGYLDICIQKLPIYLRQPTVAILDGSPSQEHSAPSLHTYTLSIDGINKTEHLQGLKRTGGGVGSSKFESDQATIESYFKKRPRTD